MLRRIWNFCCSLKLAIVIATLATFLLMGGSLLFPGNPNLFAPMDQMPLGRWLEDLAARNPSLGWWFYLFLVAMVLLGVNTCCCFIDWATNLKTRWRKTGEYMIHLGVALLILGFGVGSFSGWRHNALPCQVGKLTPLPNWPGHYLAVDSFTPKFSGNGPPTDMISQIRLLSGDQQLLSGEVRINHPILENGLVITPASFTRLPIGFKTLIQGQTHDLRPGDQVQLNNGDRLKILGFYADARINSQGHFQYRNDRLGSPAYDLELISADAIKWRGWYFLTQNPPAPLRDLAIRPLQPLYALSPSLTINYDPGVYLSAIGAVLTALGCLLALVSFYRKRRTRDRPDIV